VRASIPQIILFWPAAPLCYSSAGFGPSNHFLWASSASALFECKLWSLELFSLGQQRLCVIRAWSSVPRIILFGSAAPLRYSNVGLGPSNYSLRASSASALFKRGLLSLKIFSLGQQCLCVIRVRASVPQIILFGLAAPLCYSSVGFNPSNRIFQPSVLSFYSNTERCPSNLCSVLSMLSNCPKYGSNMPVWMPYVKYEDKSIVSNTGWPGIRIKRALPRKFPCLQHEEMHRWTHRVPCNY
jgi:hypothetical protein